MQSGVRTGVAERYRLNVAAVIVDRDGRVLLGERLDVAGSWQFPQGGVKRNESLQEALVRELCEEVALEPAHYRIEARSGPHCYRWERGPRKGGCVGQKQYYFLLRMAASPDVATVHTESPEFRRLNWFPQAEIPLEAVYGLKRGIYRKVLEDFFGPLQPAQPVGP